jgi:ring-1,2-phenylacetyl-CoA epoxidase subunit PaaB
MKRWNFTPYHQQIDEGLAILGTPLPEHDTQWPEWEVFVQAKRGGPHINVGAVHAPDPEMALLLAKENFIRREPCVNLWIVNTEDIHATASEDDALFQYTFDRTYRNTTGFKLDKPTAE